LRPSLLLRDRAKKPLHSLQRNLCIPREELERREKEYRERAARNPRKRGPKPKVKPSVSRDHAADA
jgi:hypothetical protein